MLKKPSIDIPLTVNLSFGSFVNTDSVETHELEIKIYSGTLIQMLRLWGATYSCDSIYAFFILQKSGECYNYVYLFSVGVNLIQ